MKLSSLVLYGSVAISIVGAFLAGHYVGAGEAKLRAIQVESVVAATSSSESLYVAGTIVELLQTGKSAEALGVAEQYARLKAPVVSECLATPLCASWVAASEDRRMRMNSLVATYGASSVSVPAK